MLTQISTQIDIYTAIYFVTAEFQYYLSEFYTFVGRTVNLEYTDTSYLIKWHSFN